MESVQNYIKKVYLITNGCPENRIDSARMAEYLKLNGYSVVNNVKNADLILFNSCGLTYFTQEHSVRIFKKLKNKKNPSAKLLMVGCLPKINEYRVKSIYDGITFGSDDVEKLGNIIESKINPDSVHANYIMPKYNTLSLYIKRFLDNKPVINLKSFYELIFLFPYELLDFTFRSLLKKRINVYPETFCIKISTGCLNECSFCAVKLSRGKLKSKAINQIVKEFKEGLNKGFTEFGLIGTDLGSYGRDINVDLVVLLNELIKIKGDYKIRLRNIQPRYLIEMLPSLCEVFKSKKITYFDSAYESGSNRILRQMKRGYKIEDFKKAINIIKDNFPFIQIRTQVIVGFPGETDDDFNDSVRVIDDLDFNYTEVYLFQPRPGTKANDLKEHVPIRIAKKREFFIYRRLIKKAIRKRIFSKKVYTDQF